MSTESNTVASLREGLMDAQIRAENGEYALALDSVRSVKTAHPRNIYVLAFEKQLEQLHQLFTAAQLTEDQKLDIMESLPGIVERAMDGQGADLSGNQTAMVKPLTEETVKQREEKSAALEWLKNQYFQHAHEYVRKGEYENALAEIRRVFIIEPSNQIAQDFESQIQQLSQLKRTRQTMPPSPAPAPRQSTPPLPPPAPPRPRPLPEPVVHHDPIIHESPKADPPVHAVGKETAKKSRFSNWVVLAIMLTIIVIGIGVFYFIVRAHRVDRQKRPPSVTPIGETTFAPPSASEERTFIISDNADLQAAASETTRAESNGSSTEQTSEQPSQGRTEELRSGATETAGNVSGPNPVMLASQQPPSSTQSTPETRGDQPAGQETSPEPFILVEQPPQIVKLEKPHFSEGAYKQGLEGQVVVQVQIDAQGRPTRAKVLTSSNPLLEGGVLEAVLQSQFSPGRMSNGPVTSSMVIPFKFRR